MPDQAVRQDKIIDGPVSTDSIITGPTAAAGVPDDTIDITIGSVTDKSGTEYGMNTYTGIGSTSPTDIDLSNRTKVVRTIRWKTDNTLVFEVTDVVGDNGWTSITLPGGSFNRADATYGGGSHDTWSWTSVSTNPIGTTGTVEMEIYH